MGVKRPVKSTIKLRFGQGGCDGEIPFKGPCDGGPGSGFLKAISYSLRGITVKA